MVRVDKKVCKRHGPGQFICRQEDVADGAYCQFLQLGETHMTLRYTTDGATVYSSSDYKLYLTVLAGGA